MRRIFGIPSPPPTAVNPVAKDDTKAKEHTPALPLSRLLAPQTPPPPILPLPMNLKRERQDSEVSDLSELEEQRMHARYLLDLASPEVSSPKIGECVPRKRVKARYAMDGSFSQMVRPAYEFMGETTSIGEVRYIRHSYNPPHSPPQSPPESLPRPRARPYGPCWYDSW
jgi:hypothetical protein